MTRDEAVDRIQEGLGFRSDLETELIKKLQEAQRYFEGRPTLPWFLVTEDADLSGTADDPAVSLPSDFIRFTEEGGVRYIDSDGDPHWLDKASFDHIRTIHRGTTSTTPLSYALRFNSIYVLPTPDESYTIRIDYYAKDTVLDTNIENLWLEHAPEVLIGRAGLLQAKILGDEVAMTDFNESLQVAVDAMLKATFDRQIEDEDIVMGSEA